MDVKSHLFIVFGSEHYNPLGVIRSLGETGIMPIAIIVKESVKLASKSRYISTLYIVDTYEDGYQLLIDRYGDHDFSDRPFIITCDDKITSYLDKHYNDIKNKFYFINAGEQGRITFYMDKENINNLARKHGFNVAETYVVNRGEIPEDIVYPVITKSISSTCGGWKDDVFVCENKKELEIAYSKIKSEVVLLQKYIEKQNELCIDGFSINQGKDFTITIAATYDYILPDRYSTLMTLTNLHDKDLWNRIGGLIKEIGYEGIFCIEFLVGQDGQLYFLEVNLRNSGWSYASTCAGMNMPYLWAVSMLKGEIPQDAYKKIPDHFKAIVELADFKTRVMGKHISLGKWIKELKSCQCYFYYNKNDKAPFWSSITSRVKQLLPFGS